MEIAANNGTVLVVEDETLVNWDVADALREDGFIALQAYDGEQALTLLGTRQDIRLVFSDINLPGRIDGIALAAEVKRRWPQIEMLLTSAHRRPEGLDGVTRNSRFVPKPYPLGAVTRRIHEIIDDAA